MKSNNNIKMIQKMEKPLDDSTVKLYLPNAKIITNKDLNKMNSIDDIFDKNKKVDFSVILFLDEKNKGHWTTLLKMKPDDNKKGIIEFFDSYGNHPANVYNFVDMNKRKELGTETNKLNELLDKCDYDVCYNPEKYQAENNDEYDVNTCGRHICNRIIQLLGKGMTLPQYYDLMKNEKKKNKESYDNVVTRLINL